MKVAITGASGFLGSHCMAAAVAAGHEVRAVVRNPAKLRAAAVLHDLHPDGIQVVLADLTDHEALRASLTGSTPCSTQVPCSAWTPVRVARCVR